MAGSPGDICLFAYSLQSSGDTWQLRSCPAPEGGCWSPSDMWRPKAAPSGEGTWRPRSYPEPGAGAVGTHGGLRAALSREAGAIVLT
jgi:hypothetical protein